MSVVVQMEMPTNCAKCDLHYICSESRGFHGFDAIREMMRLDTVNDKREDEHCLFICSLPEGHGRLVDKDEMLKKIENYHRYMTVGRESDPRCIIEDAPTIVPAETAERSET